MGIVSSITIDDQPVQSDGLKQITHVFTDNLSKTQEIVQNIPAAWTETEYAAERAIWTTAIETMQAQEEIDEALAQAEKGINPDKVPDHQTQSEFDRRVLGRLMLVADVQMFYAGYSMFQAVESRGGANAGQRASYLGVTTTSYNLMATRFNDVNGIAFFLDDEKNQIWTELPEDFD